MATEFCYFASGSNRLNKQPITESRAFGKAPDKGQPREGKMFHTAFAAVPARWIIVSESFQHLLLLHDFFETGLSPHLSFTTRAPKEPSPSLATQSEMKMASASGKDPPQIVIWRTPWVQ